MKIMQAFFTALFFLFSLCSLAQPSHFILRDEVLSGTSIYGVVQDKDLNYWLATDNGVMRYNGYRFIKADCSEMKGNSIFGLKKDNLGNIFCNNLSGQIFILKDNSCSLYFQIPDSLMAAEIFFAFDDQNSLIVATNSIFKVDAGKEISIIQHKVQQNSPFGNFYKKNRDTLIVYNSKTKQIIGIHKGQIASTLDFSHIDPFYPSSFLHFFEFNNTTVCYVRASGKLIPLNDPAHEYNSLKAIAGRDIVRLYPDNNKLWVARQTGGMIVFDKKLDPLYNGDLLFGNDIISSFCRDAEGNILLGTFGSGIIVIPDFSVTDISSVDPSMKVTRIASSESGLVFTGMQNGHVYKTQAGKNTLLDNNTIKNIEALYYFNATDELLIDKPHPSFYSLKTGRERTIPLGSVKDVTQVGPGEYLVASNKGIYYYDPLQTKRLNVFFELLPESDAAMYRLEQYPERTGCVEYDPAAHTIYAGTPQGLKLITKKGSTFLQYGGKAILCKDLLFYEGKIYIATAQYGIFIAEKGRITGHWTVETGLASANVNSIKQYKNQLYAATQKGLQVLTLQGIALYTINSSYGLQANSITDFEIVKDTLWLVHQKGVQTVALSALRTFNFVPSLKISAVYVNDSLVPPETAPDFKYDQNKFSFVLEAPTIAFREEVSYRYKLVGIENEWQQKEYAGNHIDYLSLPAGTYTLMVKAVCRKNESETLSYHFTITPPFWSTWWFYALLGLSFIGIVFYVYLHQTKKRLKKARAISELNASKLTAIQSQMNPHFIFNALNSIQALVLKGDVENSYTYISRFSDLVRNTLNYSDKDFIPFGDELKLITLYLTLEKLRFKDSFEYRIEGLEDIEGIAVPPMLIQPFIENALLHGLLHKEGEKKIIISFKLEEQLICTIHDNGVGRAASGIINARRKKLNESFAVNAIEKRFQILQDNFKGRIGFEYEDLLENGVAAGTKLRLWIPVKRIL